MELFQNASIFVILFKYSVCIRNGKSCTSVFYKRPYDNCIPTNNRQAKDDSVFKQNEMKAYGITIMLVIILASIILYK